MKLIDQIFSKPREELPDQCRVGLEFILDKVKVLGAHNYMEIGCAKTMTFSLFDEVLLTPSLVIGIDLRSYTEWDNYKSPNNSEVLLLSGGSTNQVVIDTTKNKLGERKLDVLFIDGNHDIDFVRADWQNFSPLVRPGGMVIFHDYDPMALSMGYREGQGAAILCAELTQRGYKIYSVPRTAIGTAYLYI